MACCDEAWLVGSRVAQAVGGERGEQVVLEAPCEAGALLLVVQKTALCRAAAWDTLQVPGTSV